MQRHYIGFLQAGSCTAGSVTTHRGIPKVLDSFGLLYCCSEHKVLFIVEILEKFCKSK